MKPNLRRCISCGCVAPKSEFLRVVRVHPDHTVQLHTGMGRSAYICPRPDCLKAAQKKNRLGRILRTAVPAAIYDALWQAIAAPPETAP